MLKLGLGKYSKNRVLGSKYSTRRVRVECRVGSDFTSRLGFYESTRRVEYVESTRILRPQNAFFLRIFRFSGHKIICALVAERFFKCTSKKYPSSKLNCNCIHLLVKYRPMLPLDIQSEARKGLKPSLKLINKYESTRLPESTRLLDSASRLVQPESTR